MTLALIVLTTAVVLLVINYATHVPSPVGICGWACLCDAIILLALLHAG